jgi:hypothetical protein
MTRARSSHVLPALIVGLGLALISSADIRAQAPGTAQSTAAPSSQRLSPARQQPAPVRTVTEAEDAGQTRTELREVLRRYSPALAGVLKLDTTLLSNPDYLAAYPGLADFLSRHPEVARDPAYFLEDVELPWVASSRREPFDAQQEAIRMWRQAMEALLIFTGILIVTVTLAWLIKTLIDYRRWSRLAKVQADVHNKVLDRFANNDELLTYVQTPAGRRFLESAPITLDPAAPAIAAPLRRILWALEAGFVLMAGGVGMQYVSGRAPAEVSPMLFAIGVLGVALGIGFILAAAVSFLISKRLGLLATGQGLNAAREKEGV